MVKMSPIFNFILWFAVSLVGTFFIISNITNPFTSSFILALIISFLGIKD